MVSRAELRGLVGHLHNRHAAVWCYQPELCCHYKLSLFLETMAYKPLGASMRVQRRCQGGNYVIMEMLSISSCLCGLCDGGEQQVERPL